MHEVKEDEVYTKGDDNEDGRHGGDPEKTAQIIRADDIGGQVVPQKLL